MELLVSPGQLERDLGASYRNLARVRSELTASGRLLYRSATKKERGVYTLVPLAENMGFCERETLSGQKILVHDYVDHPKF